MAFLEEREKARRRKTGAQPEPKAEQETATGLRSVSPVFLAVAGVAVLIPLGRRFGWFDSAADFLEKRGISLPFGRSKSGGGTSAGGSAGVRQPAKGKVHSVQPAAASSLPRNKAGNNKKNRARKAEKQDDQQRKREADAARAVSGRSGAAGPGALPSSSGQNVSGGGGGRGSAQVVRLNNVPDDSEILGGEAGKTFTTHSKFTTSEMYARIREDRGGV